MENLKKLLRSEKGSVLPIVLALLVLGMMVVPPVVNYAATGINSSRAVKGSMDGLYAAEAGIEDTLWQLKNGLPPPTQLSQAMNGMNVAIQIQTLGTYTVYFGELVEAAGHSDYLDISGDVVWDEVAQAYKYIITVAWLGGSGTSGSKVSEIGVSLPPGVGYQTGSASLFSDNLSAAEPTLFQDEGGTDVKWVFGEPRPEVTPNNPLKTQTFYMTGEIVEGGDYTCAVAARSDVGTVGELLGGLYIITATATRPGSTDIMGEVVAEILQAEDSFIVSWQIIK